jgi:hypothetical protein
MILSRQDLEQIRTAVGKRTGSPVARIHAAPPEDHPHRGVLEAMTLVKGDCSAGYGERFWVQRRAHGWSVVKKAGYWADGELE